MLMKCACFLCALFLMVCIQGQVFGQLASQEKAEKQSKVEQHAMLLADALLSIELDDRVEAAAILERTDPAFRGTPFRLLHHLLDQKPAERTGIKVPKPNERYTLAIAHPHARQVAYLCEGAKIIIFNLNELNNDAAEPISISSSRGKLLIYGEFSSDGRRFVAGDVEGGVIVWDTESWDEIAVFTKGQALVRRVRIDKTGQNVMAEMQDGIVLWSVSRKKEVGVVGKRLVFNTSFCFSEDQKHFATAGAADFKIHNVTTGEIISSVGQAPYPGELAFSKDGKYLASGLRGSLNKWLGVFEVATGKTVFDRAKHKKGITGLVFLDEGKCLLATSVDGALKFWHVPSGTQLLAIEMGASIFQPTCSADGSVILWNKRGGPRCFLLPKLDVNATE